MLEEQYRTALRRVGFDAACGTLLADKQGRDRLMYDLLEPVRPMVDGRLLSVLAPTTFTSGAFSEVTEGARRLHPQLARSSVATGRLLMQPRRGDIQRLRATLLAPTHNTPSPSTVRKLSVPAHVPSYP